MILQQDLLQAVVSESVLQHTGCGTSGGNRDRGILEDVPTVVVDMEAIVLGVLITVDHLGTLAEVLPVVLSLSIPIGTTYVHSLNRCQGMRILMQSAIVTILKDVLLGRGATMCCIPYVVGLILSLMSLTRQLLIPRAFSL